MKSLVGVVCVAMMSTSCDSESANRSCHDIACEEPFTVRIQMDALDQPTTVQIRAEGAAVTFECPPPPEPGDGGQRCNPEIMDDGPFLIWVELWNTSGSVMNVYVTKRGEVIGPDEATINVQSGGQVLFEDSFAADYGEGYEAAGPGCGKCYGPVEFTGALRGLPSVDGSAP